MTTDRWPLRIGLGCEENFMIEFLGYLLMCFASVQSTHFASAKALAIRPRRPHICAAATPGPATAAAPPLQQGRRGGSRRLTFMSCVLLLGAATIACECVAVCIGLRWVIS